MILDHQHAHPDIVHHNASQRHHTPRPRSALPVSAGVLHSCDRQPAITYVMFRTTSALPVAAAAIAAATVIAALGSSSPSSAGPPTQPQMQQSQQDAVRFARCMRSHGVPNFPDPTSPQEFKLSLSPSSAGNAQSPAFQSAETACQHLLPGGGPPSQSAAQRQAQIVAVLAFARCLRSHGFPSFPDPTSSGQLTHEMLANAGIDLHQPAVLQAADACVSVTHGVLTKAAVARFASDSKSPSSSSSGGPPTQAQMQQFQQDAARFAGCMRSHGVPNFPDPTSPQEFKLSLSPSSGGNARSPAFQSAQTACQHLLTGGGPPRQSAAQRQAQHRRGAGVRPLPAQPRVPELPRPHQQRPDHPRDARQRGDKRASAGGRAGRRRVRQRHPRGPHQGGCGPLRRGTIDRRSGTHPPGVAYGAPASSGAPPACS